MFDEVIPDGARDALVTLTDAQVLPTDTYLAGGTALALQIGHRRSVDLDFFTSVEFDPDLLAGRLRELPDMVIERTDVGTVLGVLARTKLSVIRYPYLLLAPTVPYQKIQLAGLLDIGAMKLSAVSDRGLRRDFVDMAVILEHFSLEELLSAFDTKFGRMAGVHIHLLKSLTYFDDAEADQHPEVLRDDLIWPVVKARIETAVTDFRKTQLSQ